MALTTIAGEAPAPHTQPPPVQPDSRQVGKVRRTELGTFLRSRRERLTPEAVGLPPSLRRRTPGLRREEVAQLAGVGVTWYTWLEQGRPINASTQVLDAIARTLRLDAAEHEHLYRLADAPRLSPAPRAPCTVDLEVQQLLDSLSLMASVLNERFDVLTWNAAYERVFPGMSAFRGRYRNAIWSLFTSPECCHPYINRAEESPRLVATLRAAYAHHVGEPYWEQFIKDLMERSPEFGRLWAQHEVAGYGKRVKIFKHPVVGRLRLTTMSLGVHAAPGTRVVVYTAADEATAEALLTLQTDVDVRHLPQLSCGHTPTEFITAE